ncbi:hypothetical protein RRG08_045426 [Elysia crispata]|uniref:Uncharacterized protein n=1 Tax=Elysia crispata TaxID=231223 RepID=A0AAE1E5W7_9GAST|nr:hypothetical protein RRG08_045426 [Elysia crispata]
MSSLLEQKALDKFRVAMKSRNPTMARATVLDSALTAQTSSNLFEVVSSADIKNLSVLPPHYNTRVLEAFLDAPEMSCIVHTQRCVVNILVEAWLQVSSCDSYRLVTPQAGISRLNSPRCPDYSGSLAPSLVM